MEKQEFKEQKQKLMEEYGKTAIKAFLEFFGDKAFYYSDLKSCFHDSYQGCYSLKGLISLFHFSGDENDEIQSFFRNLVYLSIDKEELDIKEVLFDKISEDYAIYEFDKKYYLYWKHY